MRRLPSGTCFTQTAIFMRGGLYCGRHSPSRLLLSQPFGRAPEHTSPYETPPDDSPRGSLPRRDLSASLAGTAGAAAPKVPEHIIFPVVGSRRSTSTTSATPRAGGAHQGNDLMAAKRSPAVAAEAGTVKFWTTSAAAGCMLYLYGESGTIVLLHPPQQRPDAEERQPRQVRAGAAYARGLKDGARVAAGQQIGYVGDSGDANGIRPHLHFEVHPGGGRAVSPLSVPAEGVQAALLGEDGKPFALTLKGTVVSATTRRSRRQRRDVAGVAVEPDADEAEPPDHARRARDDADPELDPTGLLRAWRTSTLAQKGEKVVVWTQPAPATRRRSGATTARLPPR